jgi:hypothetical protein
LCRRPKSASVPEYVQPQVSTMVCANAVSLVLGTWCRRQDVLRASAAGLMLRIPSLPVFYAGDRRFLVLRS